MDSPARKTFLSVLSRMLTTVPGGILSNLSVSSVNHEIKCLITPENRTNNSPSLSISHRRTKTSVRVVFQTSKACVL